MQYKAKLKEEKKKVKKEMSKITNENYYQISGWMLNVLKLKGTALNVYAIIYGFTQDSESEFCGSRQYLCDFTGATKPTIDKALEELITSGLIIKNSYTINNVTFCKYKANIEAIKNFATGKETLSGGGKETLSGGGKETLHNNDIINNNIIDNKNERKKASTTFDDIINSQTQNEEVKQALYEFIKMRKLNKKPMTNRALELIIDKLKKMAGNDADKAVAIINQSIERGWQGIFELPEQKKQENAKSKFAIHDYTSEELISLFDNLDEIKL